MPAGTVAYSVVSSLSHRDKCATVDWVQQVQRQCWTNTVKWRLIQDESSSASYAVVE